MWKSDEEALMEEKTKMSHDFQSRKEKKKNTLIVCRMDPDKTGLTAMAGCWWKLEFDTLQQQEYEKRERETQTG